MYNFKITESGQGIWPTPISHYNDELMPTLAAPTFSPSAGTYGGAQSVEISHTTSGVTIFYTTDGSTPNAGSNLYTGAITVSSDTTIKAIAVKLGEGQSDVATAAYVIVSDLFEDLDNWDTVGTVTVDEGGLNVSTTAGQENYARSKWYLTGDFIVDAKVTITGRSAGRTHETNMWISRESDNTCFAAHRNTWDTTSGWSPQWRGWDSCSPVTHMGVVGTTTIAEVSISRIQRIGGTIYTYVKHDQQVGWPNSSFILTGQDTSFVSGVPATADCHVNLGAKSRTPNNPTATVRWEYLNVISGTIVNP